MTATEKLTPAMRQWREMKDRHPDKLLFFRMGDFYELFYDDAVKGSRLLGLTLTKRGKDEDAPPLAGIPHHQLDRYLKDLHDLGISAVIGDQLEDPALAKGVVKRGITRVVTPGTVLDDNVLPPRDNNFLASLAIVKKEAAIAFIDLSTGEFFIVPCSPDRLEDEFERWRPAETLVPSEIVSNPQHPLASLLAHSVTGGITRRDSYQFDPHEGGVILRERFQVETLAGFGIEDKPACLGAAGAILAYLKENQAAEFTHLKAPRLREDDGLLKLDRNSIRNLELIPANRSASREATLLGVIDRTRTGPGGRLLRSWLLQPLARLEPILERQEAVLWLMADQAGRSEISSLLDGLSDLERIAARITANRATPRDLAALAASCRLLPSLSALVAGSHAELLRQCADLDPMQDLADLIEAAIVPEPPVSAKDGGLVRPGFSEEVDELRDIRSGGKQWLTAFQEEEQRRSGIPSLKVGYNRVFGYYIEITHTHKDKIPEDYVRKQTLTNAERYITPALKEHEEKVLGAESKLLDLEFDIFCMIRDEVAKNIRRLQDSAERTARLDALLSLAAVSADRKYIMPELHDGLETEILEGRHPVVESLLPQGSFVDNDVVFDPREQRILIITGPNMAGKSTYIRQCALLYVMAQIGMAIPAKSARIGLADRVFTRVGAADDLSRGLSTFMVEMVETADILNNATERSILILDEVGRGTSTFDGVSLAWAITEYIHHQIGARTMFATHYHELAELGHILDMAKNFNVAVKDWGKEITFLHKIEPGACNRSYGIHVGQIAGIPRPVVDRATEILRGLEAQASERDYQMLKDSRKLLIAAAREVQLELFAPPKPLDEVGKEVVLELAKIDVNRLTPIDAQLILSRLVEKANGK